MHYEKELAAMFAAKALTPAGSSIASVLGDISDLDGFRSKLAIAVMEAKDAIDKVLATTDNPYQGDREAVAAAIIDRVKKIRSH